MGCVRETVLTRLPALCLDIPQILPVERVPDAVNYRWDVLPRAQVFDPAPCRVACGDRHCPALMRIHTSPILTGQDNAGLRQKLRDMLVQLSKEARAALLDSHDVCIPQIVQ